jgi:hypothetical protein
MRRRRDLAARAPLPDPAPPVYVADRWGRDAEDDHANPSRRACRSHTRSRVRPAVQGRQGSRCPGSDSDCCPSRGGDAAGRGLRRGGRRRPAPRRLSSARPRGAPTGGDPHPRRLLDLRLPVRHGRGGEGTRQGRLRHVQHRLSAPRRGDGAEPLARATRRYPACRPLGARPCRCLRCRPGATRCLRLVRRRAPGGDARSA